LDAESGNRQYKFKHQYFKMVGAERFELPTLCSQNRFNRLWKSVENG